MTDLPGLFAIDAGGLSLPPVVAFATLVNGQIVGLALDVAKTADQLRSGHGLTLQVGLTAQSAIEIGRALIEAGELAARPADVVIS